VGTRFGLPLNRASPQAGGPRQHRFPVFGPLLVRDVVAKERLLTRLIGHSGPLLSATKDIDISEAAVLAKLVLS
jgi:hypothetical protein